MSALNGPRNQVWKSDKAVDQTLDVQLKQSAVVFNGGVVVRTGGYGRAGFTGLGLVAIGFADFEGAWPSVTGNASVDGGVLSNGKSAIRVRQGLGRLNNSTSTDQIAAADIGKLCFLVDDQTVAKTDGGGTRSIAGVIEEVDSQGVWVSIGEQVNALIIREILKNGTGNTEEIVANGPLSVTRRTSRLAVSGTMAFTLADGQVSGQRKTIFGKSAASTPSGVVTPAHASGFTTITFGAGTANASVELEWDDSVPAWKVVGVNTVGTLTIA